jgi:hypothetical protein
LLLSLYHTLIGLRQEHAALRAGDTWVVDSSAAQIYSLLRQSGDETLLIERPSFSTPGKKIEPKKGFNWRDPLSDEEKTRSLSIVGRRRIKDSEERRNKNGAWYDPTNWAPDRWRSRLAPLPRIRYNASSRMRRPSYNLHAMFPVREVPARWNRSFKRMN